MFATANRCCDAMPSMWRSVFVGGHSKVSGVPQNQACSVGGFCEKATYCTGVSIDGGTRERADRSVDGDVSGQPETCRRGIRTERRNRLFSYSDTAGRWRRVDSVQSGQAVTGIRHHHGGYQCVRIRCACWYLYRSHSCQWSWRSGGIAGQRPFYASGLCAGNPGGTNSYAVERNSITTTATGTEVVVIVVRCDGAQRITTVVFE